MKHTFSVTLKKTTVFKQTVMVEAESKEQAELLGLEEVRDNPEWDYDDESTTVDRIEEMP
jgi:hypothetical protein